MTPPSTVNRLKLCRMGQADSEKGAWYPADWDHPGWGKIIWGEPGEAYDIKLYGHVTTF